MPPARLDSTPCTANDKAKPAMESTANREVTGNTNGVGHDEDGDKDQGNMGQGFDDGVETAFQMATLQKAVQRRHQQAAHQHTADDECQNPHHAP